MCVIFVAHRAHPKHPLLVLANRDEFYDRPTAAAGYWSDHPNIYAGRDLVLGGTWLGVGIRGRFAAVTNYREPGVPAGKRSRGELVADYLRSDIDGETYLQSVAAKEDEYSGFNLLVGLADREVLYFSNRDNEIRRLGPGIYGLSNHLLNSAWPKVTNGLSRFEGLVANDTISKNGCFELLADETLAADKELPDTGVGTERERILSPIFIRTSIYGTRSSTVLLVDNANNFDFDEKVFV